MDAQRNGGFALVVVLWFLALTAVVVAPFAASARSSVLIAANVREAKRLDLMAEGMANLIAAHLSGQDVGASGLLVDSTPYGCTQGTLKMSMRLQDQAGLINLNTANEKLIALGLHAAGVPDPQVADLTRAMVSFRSYEDRADQVLDEGAIQHGPKHGFFESVTELGDFRFGETVDPLSLGQIFTVHSRFAGLVDQAIPSALRSAIGEIPSDGISFVGDTGLDAFLVEVWVERINASLVGHTAFIARPTGNGQRFLTLERLPRRGMKPSATPLECPNDLARRFSALTGTPAS